jgi:hypothetical protein
MPGWCDVSNIFMSLIIMNDIEGNSEGKGRGRTYLSSSSSRSSCSILLSLLSFLQDRKKTSSVWEVALNWLGSSLDDYDAGTTLIVVVVVVLVVVIIVCVCICVRICVCVCACVGFAVVVVVVVVVIAFLSGCCSAG